MQVAWPRPALRRSELHHVNVISAAGFSDSVQRLMNIAYKVHQKLERLNSIRSRGIPIRQHALENLNPIDYAIMVVMVRFWVFFIDAKTIPALHEPVRIHGDIHKMPAISFWTLASDFVRPSGGGCQIIVAQKFVNALASRAGKVRPCDVADDLVPFGPPGKRRYREAYGQQQNCRKLSHRREKIVLARLLQCDERR